MTSRIQTTVRPTRKSLGLIATMVGMSMGMASIKLLAMITQLV